MKANTPPTNYYSIGAYPPKQCFTRAQNDYDPDVDPDDRDPVDPFQQAIMESGNEYEAVVGLLLASALTAHFVIDTRVKMGPTRMARVVEEARSFKLVMFESDRTEGSITLREELTHALLENPGHVRVLWNPRLRKWKKDGRGRLVWTNRACEPDLLYRQNVRVAKSPKWGSIDVKWHNPFEGSAKGLSWAMSTLDAPFPEKSTPVPWVGTLQKKDAKQLAHYQRGLEFHGLAGSPVAGIIGKPLDEETRIVWLDLNDKLYERGTISALALYDEAYGQVTAVIEREIARRTDRSLPHLAPEERKEECKTCPWETVCYERLSMADHISLLIGVTPSKLEAHYNAGITTVAQLAKLDVVTASLVEAGVPKLSEITAAAKDSLKVTDTLSDVLVNVECSQRDASMATSKLTAAGLTTAAQLAKLDSTTARYAPGTKGLIKSIDQARVVDYARVRRMTHVFRARGVENLFIPSAPVEIHVDMENDEHIYLWGMHTVWHYKGGRVRRDYTPFVGWEATDECEAQVFAQFWAGMQAMIAKAHAQEGPNGVLVFHYTAAEDRCMRHLAEEHAGKPGIPSLVEVDAFLESDTWVDLYPILVNQLIWPTEDGTLKSLAKYVQFAWRDDDPSGSNSVVWYQTAIDPNAPEHDKCQRRILEYNEDDCKATAALLGWLQELGSVNTLGRKIARVEDLELRYRRRR